MTSCAKDDILRAHAARVYLALYAFGRLLSLIALHHVRALVAYDMLLRSTEYVNNCEIVEFHSYLVISTRQSRRPFCATLMKPSFVLARNTYLECPLDISILQ